jgi:hypothetical protein
MDHATQAVRARSYYHAGITQLSVLDGLVQSGYYSRAVLPRHAPPSSHVISDMHRRGGRGGTEAPHARRGAGTLWLCPFPGRLRPFAPCDLNQGLIPLRGSSSKFRHTRTAGGSDLAPTRTTL